MNFEQMYAPLLPITLFFGSLGFFYLGMKSLGFALQALSGDLVFKGVGRKEERPLKSYGMGALTSFCVNSSSVTLQSAMSLVNAGLIRFESGLALALGANLGATVLPWFLCVLTASIFYFPVGHILLALGSIAVILVRSHSFVHKMGRACLAFSLMLLSTFTLMLMFHGQIPMPAWVLELAKSWGDLTDMGLGAHFVLWLAGALLAAIFRSSLMVIVLAFVLSTTQTVGLADSCVLVLGANSGKVIYGLWLGHGGSVYARRICWSHLWSNNLASIFLYVTLYMVFPSWWENSWPLAVPLLHSVHGLLQGLLLLPLLKVWSSLLKKMIPDDPVKEQYHLKVVGTGTDLSTVTSLAQCYLQIEKQVDIIERQFLAVEKYLGSKVNEPKDLHKIKDYERIVDNIYSEIVVFIRTLTQKPLLANQSKEAFYYLMVSEKLELLSDHLDKMATSYTYIQGDDSIPMSAADEMNQFLKQVKEYYEFVVENLLRENPVMDNSLEEKNYRLKAQIEDIRTQVAERWPSLASQWTVAVHFSDILVAIRKFRGHTYSLSKLIDEYHHKS